MNAGSVGEAASSTVPCLDPPRLWQEPVQGPGRAAALVGWAGAGAEGAAAGEQGSLLAPVSSSHLPAPLPCRWHWQKQTDEQISSWLLAGRHWPWGLENSVFPLPSACGGSCLGQKAASIGLGCRLECWSGGDQDLQTLPLTAGSVYASGQGS